MIRIYTLEIIYIVLTVLGSLFFSDNEEIRLYIIFCLIEKYNSPVVFVRKYFYLLNGEMRALKPCFRTEISL